MLAGAASIKVRFGDFETITRSTTLDRATDLTDDLWRAGRTLFNRWAGAAFSPVRLIGFTAETLTLPNAQADLFPDASRDRRRRLDNTLDAINDRFGTSAVHRAGSTPRRSRDVPPDDRVPEER